MIVTPLDPVKNLDLGETESIQDLATMLKRLELVGEPQVVLQVTDNLLSVYGCTQMQAGLLDDSATIIVQRSYKLEPGSASTLYRVVPLRSILDRIARLGPTDTAFDAPESSVVVAWAGVMPPRHGWIAERSVDIESLRAVAKQGMDRIKQMAPADAGKPVIDQIRKSIWSLPIFDQVPAGVAFALETLGFLQDAEAVSMSSTDGWLRFNSPQGNVLVRVLRIIR